jgi:hypothetical protein
MRVVCALYARCICALHVAPRRASPIHAGTAMQCNAMQFVTCNMRYAPRRMECNKAGSRWATPAQPRGSQRGRRTPSSARDLPARTTRAATCAQWPCCRVKARASGSGRETRVQCSDMRRRCCALRC